MKYEKHSRVGASVSCESKKKSTYESVDAQQDEVDRDYHRSLDVDYSTRDWVVVDEQEGKKSLLVRRIPKRILRCRQHSKCQYSRSALTYNVGVGLFGQWQ